MMGHIYQGLVMLVRHLQHLILEMLLLTLQNIIVAVLEM